MREFLPFVNCMQLSHLLQPVNDGGKSRRLRVCSEMHSHLFIISCICMCLSHAFPCKSHPLDVLISRVCSPRWGLSRKPSPFASASKPPYQQTPTGPQLSPNGLGFPSRRPRLFQVQSGRLRWMPEEGLDMQKHDVDASLLARIRNSRIPPADVDTLHAGHR
jgi:hypothetical protein